MSRLFGITFRRLEGSQVTVSYGNHRIQNDWLFRISLDISSSVALVSYIPSTSRTNADGANESCEKGSGSSKKDMLNQRPAAPSYRHEVFDQSHPCGTGPRSRHRLCHRSRLSHVDVYAR